MKWNNSFFIPLLIVLFLSSCLFNSNEQEHNRVNINESPSFYTETPNSKLVSREYGGGGRDIVNELFKTAKKEDEELEKLVKKIDELDKTRREATRVFDNYNARNRNYWNSVNWHIGMIRDSSEAETMRILFKKLKKDYNTSIEPLQQKIDQLNKKASEMNDQVEKMKLVTSAKMMKKYQADNKPSLGNFDQIIKEYDNIIKETEKYTTY